MKQDLFPTSLVPSDGQDNFRSACWTAFTITAVLLFLQLFFVHPYYLVNDDVFKVLMVKGIGITDRPLPYFLYSNVLLGFIFMKLNTWFPSYPFYAWFLSAVQFLSLSGLLWLLGMRSSGWFHKTLFLTLVLGIEFIFFFYLHFTMAALMAGTTGFLLFAFSLEPFWGAHRRLAKTLAGCLLVLSWLIRFHCFLLLLLVVLPLFFFVIRSIGFRPWWKKHWKFILLITVVIGATGLADSLWVRCNPGWSAFEAYNSKVGRFHEFSMPSYSDGNRKAFNDAGWSENDAWLFTHWFWMDADKFSETRIDEIEKALPQGFKHFNAGAFDSWKALAGYFWNIRCLFCLVVFCLFCSKRVQPWLWVQGLWLFLIFLFLMVFMKAIDQITVPLLVYWISLALVFCEKPDLGFSSRKVFGWLPVLALAGFVLYSASALDLYWRQNVEKQKVEAQIKDDLAQLHPSKDQLFIAWSFPYELFGAYDNYEEFRSFNMIPASFIQRSPAVVDMAQRFGGMNVFRLAVNDPNVFLMCTPEQGMHYHQYMAENFRIAVHPKKVYDCPYFKVFSVLAGKEGN